MYMLHIEKEQASSHVKVHREVSQVIFILVGNRTILVGPHRM